MSYKKNGAGFTLVELLVVIAVIGILSVGLLVTINPVKQLQKSRDTARKTALKQMHTAIQSYMIKTVGTPPINRTPGAGYCSNQANFLQELVDSQELKQIPKEPGSGQYCYYDYGPNNNIGALLVTTLEEIDATTVAPEGSCRPFNTANWCSSTNPSKHYCLCLPY